MKLSSAHVSVASVCAHSQVELTITTFSLGLLPDPYWELGCIFPLKIILGQCPDSGSEPAFFLSAMSTLQWSAEETNILLQ